MALSTVVACNAEEWAIENVPTDVEPRHHVMRRFESDTGLQRQPGKDHWLGAAIGPARLRVTRVVVVARVAEVTSREIGTDARLIRVGIIDVGALWGIGLHAVQLSKDDAKAETRAVNDGPLGIDRTRPGKVRHQ